MDLRMPISRTRSEMLASMMFMMPMPPTSRLMAAIMPPLSRALRMKRWIFSAQSSLCAERKIFDAFVRGHEHIVHLLNGRSEFVDVANLHFEAAQARVRRDGRKLTARPPAASTTSAATAHRHSAFQNRHQRGALATLSSAACRLVLFFIRNT